MSFLLSWQQKFRALVALTLLGLTLMAAASLWASQRLSASLEARERAAAYAGASTEMMNHWWRQHALRQQLSPERQEAFAGGLEYLQDLVGQLLTQVQSLDDADTLQHARQIQAVLLEEIAEQRHK